MNTWEPRKLAIVEADDFMDRYDRNGLNMLFYWKAKYPKFKISLFTVPDKTSEGMLELLDKHSNWIEICVHGWNHESNFECYDWDYDKTKALMTRALNKGNFKPIFKAPGWCITGGTNGYPAQENQAVAKDPTAVYRSLLEMGFTIFDRHYNSEIRPNDSRIICIDDNPDIVDFHTWNVPSSDVNGRNGFQDVEENFGAPWNQETLFYFISEAIKLNLFKPCIK